MTCDSMLPILILALACTACDSCSAPPPQSGDAPPPGKGTILPSDHQPSARASSKKVHETVPAVIEEATIVEQSGAVEVTRSEKTRKTPGLSSQKDRMFMGDSISTGEDGSARLDIGQKTHLSLGPSSTLSIGTHRPLEMVIHRGRITLAGEKIRGYTRRFKLMTPGGAFFHAGPRTELAVADDGTVRVDVVECPEKPPRPKSLQKIQGKEDDRRRCSMIVGDEEQFLITADSVLVMRDLGVKQSTTDAQDVSIGQWLSAANEAMARDPAPAVKQFAGWILPAMEQVRTHMKELTDRRARNKELIKKLRDLRKAGKPDPSKASGAKATGGPASEMQAVKEELRENSAAQYQLRHLLLARYHMVMLRFELLEPHLTDQALEASSITAKELGVDVQALGAELAELISRKPHRKVPPKLMPRHLLKKGPPAPKKPVEKSP